MYRQNDRFKHLQEILETIHIWLKQPANATNVSIFPFPHVTTPAPTIPPPPAPIGLPMNHRGSAPLANNSQITNHQYQVPNVGTPIYAVSNVIHNNANPNVKNISQLNTNWSGNGHQLPLQLQIPNMNPTQLMLNNQRSGSQASSGYQSQSPVLEGEDKNKKLQAKENINIHISNLNKSRICEGTEAVTALTFSNPVFTRKSGSQSVDDLSSLGVDLITDTGYRRR